jgi:hypothetical protein
MNKNLILTITLVSLIVGCNQKVKTVKAINTPDTTESNYVQSTNDTLPQLSLPITLTPDSWGNLYDEYINKYGINSGVETESRPYAKLIDHKNYKAIIFISPDETGSPTLITFGNDGNKINELSLLGDWGSNDAESKTTESATINENLSIQLIDSIWTYEVVSEGQRIASSEKLAIKKELYKIFDSGEIKKMQ